MNGVEVKVTLKSEYEEDIDSITGALKNEKLLILKDANETLEV